MKLKDNKALREVLPNLGIVHDYTLPPAKECCEVDVERGFPKTLALLGRSLVLAHQSFDKNTAEHQKARDKALDIFVSEVIEATADVLKWRGR